MFVFSPRTVSRNAGYTLTEVLIVMGLMGVLAALSINLLLNQGNANKWGRVTADYVHQLASAYNVSKTTYGKGPLAAKKCNTTTTCTLSNAYDDGSALKGISALLYSWETAIVYSSSAPKRFTYPGGIVVYIQPDAAAITDPNNEIPNGTITYADATPDDIAGALANDWEWLLVDMNGTEAPNSTQTTGDRVLLFVDDDTGRILTGWQFCIKNGGTEITPGVLCRVNDGVTNYNFYKSYYDVYQDYTFANQAE